MNNKIIWLKVSITINIFIIALMAGFGIKQYVKHQKKQAERAAYNAKDHIASEVEDFEYISKVDQFANLPNTTGGIVMLGDSLTGIGEWHEYFLDRKIRNRGISGDNTFGILSRLDSVIASKPEKLFIMAGTNDIYLGSNTKAILTRYKAIVDKVEALSPTTQIIVQSTPYYTIMPKVKYGSLSNQSINELNVGLKKLALSNGLTYVDVNAQLSDGNKLNAAYTTDGIHLNGAGYNIWAQTIMPYM
jgi:lysophospholipase L1-like esterase